MAFIQEELSILSYTTSTTLLTTTEIPFDNSLNIFVNGAFQPPTNFSIQSNEITFFSVIPSEYNIWASYEYQLGPVPVTTTPPPSGYCEDHESILPANWRGGTNLSPSVTSYQLLAERIKMQLGFPVVRTELCDDMIYDYIDQAVEWYTKYVGYTEEYLMFNSSIYKCGLGIKMDNLFTAHACYHCTGDESHLVRAKEQFYDCDLAHYRKVVDVVSVDPVNATGTETLFNMDYLFAQQSYFSYLLGGFGFDLTTWHILKEWLDLRKKMFATEPYVRFDPRTQYLRIIPEPTRNRQYIGVVKAYVERSAASCIGERWCFQYALALTKIGLANIRGKYGALQLFGGGGPSSQDLMTQGMAEKERLERELIDQPSDGPSLLPWFCG